MIENVPNFFAPNFLRRNFLHPEKYLSNLYLVKIIINYAIIINLFHILIITYFIFYIVNKVATGIRKARGIWYDWVSKPAAGVLSILYPGSNNLTDKLLEISDYINKGLDWVIDKTSDKKPINPKPIPEQPKNDSMNVSHELNNPARERALRAQGIVLK